MKVVVQVRLFPSRAQAAALRATLDLCNFAANWTSAQAYHQQVHNKQALQRLTYGELKALGLSAQPAIHVARKVAGAYNALKANIQAGSFGPPGSKRRLKAESKPIRFRANAAQPFDDRCLSWQLDEKTISIWTVRGRLGKISFGCSDAQLVTLNRHRHGESDLVHRDGMWFLHATCDLPEPDTSAANGFLGVDLGIINLATTNDGTHYCGKTMSRIRHRHQRLRTKLQTIGSKSAKRLLKKRARKESRFASDLNHRISKEIVAEAKRTERGIALENLKGIRDRVRLRRPQRATLHSWAFNQLGCFIEYKAKLAGVPMITVDPAYTSQRCSACQFTARSNRSSRATFRCTSCGFTENADVNAAHNIALRGLASWVASQPAKRGTTSAPISASS